MTVEGSYQVAEGQPISISRVYDQTLGGNGKSYVLSTEPLMTTRYSVRDVLAQHEEFSKFLELMDGSGLFESIHNKRFGTASQNVSSFNTYHYTVYVPTNESIERLQNEGRLSSWEKVDQYELDGNLTDKTKDSLQIVNFLKYHIQDHAHFIGAEEEKDDFETALIDPVTERFYRLGVDLNNSGITLKDKAGNTRHVVMDNRNLYNLQAREYQYKEQDATKANQIETTSTAVIHLIDEPLLVNN